MATSTLTPTPSVTMTRPVKRENIKQLLRRYSDGTLVAKTEIYKKFDGYQHRQDDPSKIWTVLHNKKTTGFIEDIYINNEVVDADITIVDGCKIIITFNEEVNGFANFVFLDSGSGEDCHYAPITPTPTATSTTTPTPTVTSSVTNTPSVTRTPNSTVTPTVTLTSTVTGTPNTTATPTPTTSVSISGTPALTITPSASPSISVTASVSPTVSNTASVTPSITSSITQSPNVISNQYADQVMADAPIAFYKLDDTELNNVFDSSGNGRHLHFTQNIDIMEPSLLNDGGYSYTMNSGYANDDVDTSYSGQDGLTYEAIIQPTGLASAATNGMCIIHWGDFVVGGGQGVALYLNSNGSVGAQFFDSDMGYVVRTTSPNVVSANEKAIITLTIDVSNNLIKFYKNGTLVATTDSGGANTIGGGMNKKVNLGYFNGAGVLPNYTGNMDCVSAYRSVLNPQRILNHAIAAGFAVAVTPTATPTPTISLTPTFTPTVTRSVTLTPTPSVTLTEHNCKFDGSSLSGWVNSGAEMQPDPTDNSKQVIGVPEYSYAYINCNQPFDISTQINVDVYMPSDTSVIDVLLGCDSNGRGIMVRLDSRNINTVNNSVYYCGFLQSSTWYDWSGDPTNGYTYAFPTGAWHTVNIRVNSLSDNGIVLDMYVDGVFTCRSVALMQYGNYIGFNGDKNGGSYGYLRNFAISRDIFITPTQTPTSTVTPSSTPSISPTISITPTNSTTPTPTPSTGWATFAHRYWRMNILSNNGDSSYVAVTELGFYNDADSSYNLVTPEFGAVNSFESGEANNSNTAGLAFDGDLSTKWTSNTTTGYIGIDFGTPQLVKSVSVIGNYAGGDQSTLAPKDFRIEYSDNNSAWTSVLTVSNQTNWGAGERRIFTLQLVTPTPTPSVSKTSSLTPTASVTPSATLPPPT